ncbi:hypothetical protein FH603_4674 [Spirosoma sp. LMG 31447]|uniref:Uncharacterized protein n=1 Tax=Spirosoma utsteinense TaxID=2585773 RepID=A0ABR6WC90_9BACT|nr:hypothetical protein [Spirosoma utsteinense]
MTRQNDRSSVKRYSHHSRLVVKSGSIVIPVAFHDRIA